jgi:hypothetical protein
VIVIAAGQRQRAKLVRLFCFQTNFFKKLISFNFNFNDFDFDFKGTWDCRGLRRR